jgi:nucleoside-diphosphate-sugar epimerase
MLNVLIVGGAGYVGGVVTDLIRASHYNVRVYDMLLYEESYRKDVDFVYGDVRDRNRLKEHLNWADVVIWLVAIVGDPACALNEQLTTEINEKSVEYLRDNFGGRIFFMSTCSVYGASDGILNESSPVNPLSLYARTKLRAEEILKDCNAIIFRLGTLYGIGDLYSRIRFDLVVNTLVMRAVTHGKISVFGGDQYRPLIHVKDVARAVLQALSTDRTGIYNLHRDNMKIIDVAKSVSDFFPDLLVEVTDVEFQDNRNYRVSSDKAIRDLGFSPECTVQQGIQELKNLLEQGRIKDSFISRFSNFLFLKPLLQEHSSPLGREVKFNV